MIKLRFQIYQSEVSAHVVDPASTEDLFDTMFPKAGFEAAESRLVGRKAMEAQWGN